MSVGVCHLNPLNAIRFVKRQSNGVEFLLLNINLSGMKWYKYVSVKKKFCLCMWLEFIIREMKNRNFLT